MSLENGLQRLCAETPHLLEAAAVPGLTVALLEGGKTWDVFCFGTTKPQGSVPVTEQTIFWSLGWGTADDDILWQWGYHVAFSAFAALVPARELGIVVLTNGTNGSRIYREWVSAWLETDLPEFPTRGI